MEQYGSRGYGTIWMKGGGYEKIWIKEGGYGTIGINGRGQYRSSGIRGQYGSRRMGGLGTIWIKWGGGVVGTIGKGYSHQN